jgi:photosystem II stability/assembly factor-like uncharacterized protein
MKTLFSTILLLGFVLNLQAQWNLQTNTSTLFSVSAVDNNIVWGCGPNSTVLRTTNGGTNWTSAGASPLSGTLLNIFGVSETTALVIGANTTASYVWRTTNSGSTWTQVFTQVSLLNGVHINSDGTGILVGDSEDFVKWSIWKTSDFGATWSSSGINVPIVNFEFGFQNSLFVDGNNYYFGSNDSRIYTSTNSGSSWTARTTTIKNPFAIWFNGSLGIAGGTSITTPGVNRSTNSGTSWSSVTVPTTSPVSGVVGDGSTFWIGRGTAIYKSTDNGATWASQYTTSGLINHMCKSRTGNRLWAVTASGNIYSSEGLLAGVSVVNSILPEKFSLSQNYPNPFNPSTKIKFAIPNSSFIKLAVYDMLGREVSSLVNENLQPGTYEYEFDASDLNSGIYFYKITTEDFSEVKKMILLK